MEAEFSEFFKAPLDYNPPRDTEINGSTQFPNLNSIEYRNRKVDNEITLLPFFEIIAENQDQTSVLLATNSYNQRVWNGAVFGYDQLDDIGKPNAATMNLSLDANVTGMSFVRKDIVIFTTASGSIQVWSTHSKIRQANGCNLFQVAKKTEHFGLITGFSILGDGDTTKAVTGSTDGCIKVWELTPCDVVSERTYRYAHKDIITAISSKPSSNDLFASCSRDRYLSIWDKRSQKPLVNTHKNEDYANTACLWLKNNGIEKLYLGDDTGTIYIYDPRKLNECLLSKTIFDRPVYKFKENPSSKLLGVLGQTNDLAVISTEEKAEIIYTDSSATDYVRDICWVKDNNQTGHTFHHIGWSQNVGKHQINSNTV